MSSTKLTCDCCRAVMFVQTPRRNATFMSIAEPAYEQGWRMARGLWFCSEDCIAASARDVTPVVPAIQ